ncbi:hypothetical protein [Streptosporangium sp. KLBMP 9127]|nr:hypothetical protein [Streptosporangium sp. KLBMP 9127]
MPEIALPPEGDKHWYDLPDDETELDDDPPALSVPPVVPWARTPFLKQFLVRLERRFAIWRTT